VKAMRSPWWIVFGSVLGLIVGNVTILQFATSVLMKPIMAEFGWPRTIPSAAVGLGSLFAAFATPFVGHLIDRRGIKPVTLSAILLFALATAAMALSPSAAVVFLVLFSVVGLLSSGQAPLPYAKSIAAAFDHRRGLALGIAMTGVGLGAALMPRLTQAFLEHFGWRGSFVALGATVFAIAFPAVALFLREPARLAGAARSTVTSVLPGFDARDVVRSRNFWVLAFVFLCIPIVANGIIFHLVALLTDRGVSAQGAVRVFAAIGPSLIVGRLICGYFLDRFHGPYVATAFIATPALGVLVLLSSADPLATSVGAVLVGLGLGAEVDLIGYLQSRYFGLRAFGQVYGYLFAIFTVGTGIGPFAMGATFDLFGSYRPVLEAFAAVLVVAGVAMLRLPRVYPFPVARMARSLAEAPVGEMPRQEAV
jgi:MFS family permease